MSGTELAHDAIGLRACCAVSGTELARGRLPSPRYRDAMSGTAIAYGASVRRARWAAAVLKGRVYGTEGGYASTRLRKARAVLSERISNGRTRTKCASTELAYGASAELRMLLVLAYAASTELAYDATRASTCLALLSAQVHPALLP
eukprot:2749416-Rhodomonas_salina.4